jgi:hypothetical protein
MPTPIPIYQGQGRYKTGQQKVTKRKDHLLILRMCLTAYLSEKPMPFTEATLRWAANACRIRQDRTMLLEMASGTPLTATKKAINTRAFELDVPIEWIVQ